MKKEYFTIYDSKVGVYREPILALNKHDILRQLDTLFREPDQKAQLFTNAEDFQLFQVGSYDTLTGQITPEQPIHIANLHELKSAVMRSNNFDVTRPERLT